MEFTYSHFNKYKNVNLDRIFIDLIKEKNPKINNFFNNWNDFFN